MNGKTDQRIHLTLRQLEVFVATARAGSTRAAADRVARSQSAASAALVELEATLGTALFDRAGRRLLLNADGRALLPRAAALLDQARELEALFLTAHATPLRLASSFTIGEYLLPGLIGQWKATHPEAQVRLDIANTSDVIDAVARADVDLGFIEGQRTHPDVTVRRWCTDRMVAVAAPGHPLAGVSATRARLAASTWILREQGSGTREAADRWLLAQLGPVEIALELGSNEACKRAVAQGLGVGCLSRRAVADALREGWLVELRTRLPPLDRAMSVVLRKGKRLGGVADGFLKLCFEAVR